MKNPRGNLKYQKLLTKDFLQQAYIDEKKTIAQIAKSVGCSSHAIYDRLKINNIKPRSISEANKIKKYHSRYSNILTKKFLYNEYITNQKTTTQIGKEVGCSKQTIRNYLIKFDIPIRNKSESKMGKNNGRYVNGYTLNINYCIDCLKQGIKTEISRQLGIKRCGRCASRISTKLHWLNPEFREKTRSAMLKAMQLSPNKPEKLLIKLLNKILPNQYTFVGDGKLVVGGFCPDFVNKANDKIIEHYGNYWHNKHRYINADKRCLIAYKKSGYKTLIIWEHELKDLDRIKNRILEFNNKENNE